MMLFLSAISLLVLLFKPSEASQEGLLPPPWVAAANHRTLQSACQTEFRAYQLCQGTTLGGSDSERALACDACRTENEPPASFTDENPCVAEEYCGIVAATCLACGDCRDTLLNYWNCLLPNTCDLSTCLTPDQACPVEFARVDRSTGLTVRQEYGAYDCNCVQIPGLSAFEIRCMLGCRVCSLGRCTDQARYRRAFSALPGIDPATSETVIRTVGIGEEHCVTYTENQEQESCTREAGRGGLLFSINGEVCEQSPSTCRDGSVSSLINCTGQGDELYDTCLFTDDFIATTSPFAFARTDFQNAPCASSINATRDSTSPVNPVAAFTDEQVCTSFATQAIGESGITPQTWSEPAHTCTCGEVETRNVIPRYEHRCFSDCTICSAGRCTASSSVIREFTADLDQEDSTLLTRSRDETFCVTYADGAQETICFYQGGEGMNAVINDQFCLNLGRRQCADGSRASVIDCTNVGDYVLDFCDGRIYRDPFLNVTVSASQSALVMATGDFSFDICVGQPTAAPVVVQPTFPPTVQPTSMPSPSPSASPLPSASPTPAPTSSPTVSPTPFPTITLQPSPGPSATESPTLTVAPSSMPSLKTASPTSGPPTVSPAPPVPLQEFAMSLTGQDNIDSLEVEETVEQYLLDRMSSFFDNLKSIDLSLVDKEVTTERRLQQETTTTTVLTFSGQAIFASAEPPAASALEGLQTAALEDTASLQAAMQANPNLGESITVERVAISGVSVTNPPTSAPASGAQSLSFQMAKVITTFGAGITLLLSALMFE